MTLTVAAVVLPALFYVVVSLSPVQNRLKTTAETELSKLLGTEVTIGRLSYTPFSVVTLYDVEVADDFGAPALTIDRLGAGIELTPLIMSQRIVVSYVELIGANATVYQTDSDSPLNIAGIIEHLKPKDKTKPPTAFDLAVNTVVIRRLSASYQVGPDEAPETFDPRHIKIQDFNADVRLPRISNDVQSVIVKRLNFSLDDRFRVDNLTARFVNTPDSVALSDFSLTLPASRLALEDISIAQPLARIVASPADVPVRLATKPGTHLSASDFGYFVAGLPQNLTLDLELLAEGTPDDLAIRHLHLSDRNQIADIRLKGAAAGWLTHPSEATADIEECLIEADAPALTALLPLKDKAAEIAGALGRTTLDLTGRLSKEGLNVKALTSTDIGDIDLAAEASRTAPYRVKGSLASSVIELRRLPVASLTDPETAAIDLSFEGALDKAGKPLNSKIDATISDLTFKHHLYSPIALRASQESNDIEAEISIDDDDVALNLSALASLPQSKREATAVAYRLDLDRLALSRLGLAKESDSIRVSLSSEGKARWSDLDNLTANLAISDLDLKASKRRRLKLDRLDILSDIDDAGTKEIFIDSDILSGTIVSSTPYAQIPPTLQAILHSISPALADMPTLPDDSTGLTQISMTLEPDNPIEKFVSLGVKPMAPITLEASLDAASRRLQADLSAPYLQKKENLLENTAVTFYADGLNATSSLDLHTAFPAKGGLVGLDVATKGNNGDISTRIDWSNRSGRNRGTFAFDANARKTRLEDGQRRLDADIDLRPGELVFNDSVWAIAPGRITVRGKNIDIDDFIISHDAQKVEIAGTVADNPDAMLRVDLNDIDLNFVFETLKIEVAMFGGDATGTFYASDLLSSSPRLYTDNLFVKDLTYNKCLMGDGDLTSYFDPATGAIHIGADIHQRNGRTSVVDGSITPVGELLDFTFTCDKAPVGFLQTFMKAFCSRVDGNASGQAHLYGTFSDVDMVGTVVAENLSMDIDITSTTYHTEVDTVVMTPGRINFDNVNLYDRNGNRALLSGYLTHRYFHDPCFLFNVTDAHNFLCYDMAENIEHPWYGPVVADGAVRIKGEPGMVTINADVRAGRGTDFTFVLSDAQQAVDYNFLVFRNKTPVAVEELSVSDAIPEMAEAIRRQMAKMHNDNPTQYEMIFNVDIKPEAQLVLVMDPVGGDRIKANGTGNVRMSYNSINDELKMYGLYTLERGAYNFTLQDIFIKDFTIKDGSSIAFHGDPYSAQLDITAYYAVQANLTDLDESFAQDRDLNRTSVPVHALLRVTGDLRLPDISFDFEFPTLQSDVYRKVRSIVSTDDMMNRQILYLLALNRFYTPEYMEATRGNELVSVASSTLSSRLGNILGQLSDKVNIAPSIRSDRGDFSDVEFDVALSSHLLNNRLLLNGTLGYRDNALNNTSFIGDFDVEYLLNRTGSIRLKAYNRYNDQNYYLKSALTTQGVGIVFKRDFDDILSFLDPLRRRWRKKQTPPSE